MGKIILDRRGKDAVLIFREKRGKKTHVVERVVIPKNDASALRTEVERVLNAYRGTAAE